MILAFIHEFLAQAPEVNVANAMWVYGPMGLMIAWFMLRVEKLIKTIGEWREDTREEMHTLGHRLDGVTRAMLMDLLDRDSVGKNTRRMAEETMAKLEARSVESSRRRP